MGDSFVSGVLVFPLLIAFVCEAPISLILSRHIAPLLWAVRPDVSVPSNMFIDLMIPNTTSSVFDVFKFQPYEHFEYILMFDKILSGRSIFIIIFMINIGLLAIFSVIFMINIGLLAMGYCVKFNRIFNIYGPRHVNSVRRLMLLGLVLLHTGGSVSFYKHSLLPTADCISVYAFNACARPVVTKLCVDPPAWFLVSQILVQLAVAACIPKFQDPLYQAMPNVLPAVVTLTVSVYLIEYMRRAAFLRSLDEYMRRAAPGKSV